MAAMRGPSKSAKAVAIWAAATSIGIGVSWYGVRSVLDAAVPDRLVAFPVTEPHAPLPAPPPAPAASGSTPNAAPDPWTATPSHSAAATPSRSARPAPPSSAPPGNTTAPAPGPAPSAPAGWTPLGNGRYVRSFQLTGGDVTIRAGQGSVELVSATPRPLYVMTVVPDGTDRVTVTFTMVLRSSRLEASWQDSAPVVKITESP
ncbi:hypothetical protein ACNTMW_20940 [Planosporangium sp. 12N6]|uniref:hypothetical protein n=1 Tax=Planosporangium spinosum TaxID=3402278 RepID=UPI003CF26FB7